MNATTELNYGTTPAKATVTIHGAPEDRGELLTTARELLRRTVVDADRWLFNDVEHTPDRARVFYLRLSDEEQDQVKKADAETFVSWSEAEFAWLDPVLEVTEELKPLAEAIAKADLASKHDEAFHFCGACGLELTCSQAEGACSCRPKIDLVREAFCAAYGKSMNELLAEAQREKALREKLGLPKVPSATPAPDEPTGGVFFPELDPPAIPLAQMTLEQRKKWEIRKQAIDACIERFKASGSIEDEALRTPAAPPRTVLRTWVKVALAVLAAGGIAFALTGCGATQAKAAAIGVELDSVLRRTQPDDRLNVNQRAKLYSDEGQLRDDVAALASGR